MELFSTRFEAIGVLNQVTVTDAAALAAADALARRQLAALDAACSRFREDSELAELNRTGYGRVSPLLLTAIEAAVDAARSTGGLVDPTVGSCLRAAGYDRDFDLIGSARTSLAEALRPASGWSEIEIDHAGSSVKLPDGCELDLGATAKALAADHIAAAVSASTGAGALVSLGGDIAVAGSPPPEGWPILVTDDSRAAAASGQVVAIRAGGLATSGTTVRRWSVGAQEMHHIIDPRTGAPAQTCWQTVSVAASSCLAANTAATACLVLGETAPDWLTDRQISARLVSPDGTTATCGAWPVEESLAR